MKTLMLAAFSFLFFAAVLFFSLRPSKILTWVGKILNPVFLLFMAVLIVTAFLNPMGSVPGGSLGTVRRTQLLYRLPGGI